MRPPLQLRLPRPPEITPARLAKGPVLTGGLPFTGVLEIKSHWERFPKLGFYPGRALGTAAREEPGTAKPLSGMGTGSSLWNLGARGTLTFWSPPGGAWRRAEPLPEAVVLSPTLNEHIPGNLNTLILQGTVSGLRVRSDLPTITTSFRSKARLPPDTPTEGGLP